MYKCDCSRISDPTWRHNGPQRCALITTCSSWLTMTTVISVCAPHEDPLVLQHTLGSASLTAPAFELCDAEKHPREL